MTYCLWTYELKQAFIGSLSTLMPNKKAVLLRKNGFFVKSLLAAINAILPEVSVQ